MTVGETARFSLSCRRIVIAMQHKQLCTPTVPDHFVDFGSVENAAMRVCMFSPSMMFRFTRENASMLENVGGQTAMAAFRHEIAFRGDNRPTAELMRQFLQRHH